MTPSLKQQTYYISGMHCASCEILIEKKLLELKNIKAAEASTAHGQVIIEYENKKPTATELNALFKKENYVFSDEPIKSSVAGQSKISKNNLLKIIILSVSIMAVFVLLNKLGLSALVNVNSNSSLPMFFLLGVLAGLSSCAALVGGIILSLSKQWLELYADKKTNLEKLQPHLLFNFGRLISYGLLGALLGALGSQLRLSLSFAAGLIIVVSLVMLLLGMQMLGVKALKNWQFRLPKIVTRHLSGETKFKGKFLPFLMGAGTFFLPCGFTITAQGLALLSGNAMRGGLIMLLFALGTSLPLLAIGLSSIKFSERPHLANTFLKTAGMVVIFFALFNINSQLNVLGAPSLNNLSLKSTVKITDGATKNNDKNLALLINGVQVIKMNASSSGYKPNYFKVRADVAVRWEITDTGTSGCTNAIISRSLFSGQINLTPGQTSVKEFTPTKAGRYKFSCWMGMVSGIIEVVENSKN